MHILPLLFTHHMQYGFMCYAVKPGDNFKLFSRHSFHRKEVNNGDCKDCNKLGHSAVNILTFS